MLAIFYNKPHCYLWVIHRREGNKQGVIPLTLINFGAVIFVFRTDTDHLSCTSFARNLIVEAIADAFGRPPG